MRQFQSAFIFTLAAMYLTACGGGKSEDQRRGKTPGNQNDPQNIENLHSGSNESLRTIDGLGISFSIPDTPIVYHNIFGDPEGYAEHNIVIGSVKDINGNEINPSAQIIIGFIECEINPLTNQSAKDFLYKKIENQSKKNRSLFELKSKNNPIVFLEGTAKESLIGAFYDFHTLVKPDSMRRTILLLDAESSQNRCIRIDAGIAKEIPIDETSLFGKTVLNLQQSIQFIE